MTGIQGGTELKQYFMTMCTNRDLIFIFINLGLYFHVFNPSSHRWVVYVRSIFFFLS